MTTQTETRKPEPPFPTKAQSTDGKNAKMDPAPDHGEESYVGCGLLEGRAAIITGGDSGIGRAVAIAFAREGADVLIGYHSSQDDAETTAGLIEDAGRKAVLVQGDIKDEAHCEELVERAMSEFGRLDILVNNAAHQATFDDIAEISAEEWDTTFRTNIYSQFYMSKAAVARMKPGGSIINTASINSTDPSPSLLAYATTKGAIANFTQGLAQMIGEKGIRVNAVAPGPIWTPLIPSTMPEEAVKNFGKSTPLGRPGQPAELAGAYVLLASERGSYMTGAVLPVTGGLPY